MLLVELAPPTAVGASSVVCTLHQAQVIWVLSVILLYCWNEDKIDDPDRWSHVMVTCDFIVLLKWRQNWWSRLINLCHGDLWFYCTVKNDKVDPDQCSRATVTCDFILLLKWRQNWWSGSAISRLVFDCSPKEQTGNIKRTERKWRRDLKRRKWVLLFALFMALWLLRSQNGCERTRWP